MHFIAVGGGDAILIEVDDGPKILIDGGSSTENLSTYLDALAIDTLDLVILTHSDRDHWRGLRKLFEAGSATHIGQFWTPGFEDRINCRTTRDYKQFERMVREHDSFRPFPPLGHQTVFTNMRLTMLSGSSNPKTGVSWWYRCPYLLNNASAVALVEIEAAGEAWRFLFTGDANGKPKSADWSEAPIDIEKDLLERFGDSLSVHVLKAGHHGSNTASTLQFLDAALPEEDGTAATRFIIVQRHKIFGFGPPSANTMETLEDLGLRRNVRVLQDFDHVYCFVPKRTTELICRDPTP